jgi:hypothetical protein
VGEAAAADELLDDGLEVVLLDGAALGDGPLLQHGGQLEARDHCGSDALVQGVGQRPRWWMGWGGGGFGGRGEASEQADARREEAVHGGAGAPAVRCWRRRVRVWGKGIGLSNGLSAE